jgi:hypothetical protein
MLSLFYGYGLIITLLLHFVGYYRPAAVIVISSYVH